MDTTIAPPQKYAMTYSRRIFKILTSMTSHGALILVGLGFILPFLWMLSTAFKSDQDVFRIPNTWLPHDNLRVEVNGQQLPLYNLTDKPDLVRQLALVKIAEGIGTFLDPANPAAKAEEIRMKFAKPVLVVGLRWQNFADAMNRATRPGIGTTFLTYIQNSLFVTFFTILGTLISCTLAAYGFARIRFPGRDILFILVLSTMMLPAQVTMIPMYVVFTSQLHWGDTFLPLIVPAFFANAWDIFLLRQFFRTIPEELCDAARVDGASEWQIFTRIVLQLSTPVLAVVTITTFLFAWNDFTNPLIYLTDPRHFTLAIGLQDFQGQHSVAYNLLMAAAVIFTIPIIIAFFFAQKTFIQGIKLTGLKE
jgi:multiple sugar transport system permease protein